MRALHLLGLRTPDQERLRFHAEGGLPLMLPHWLSMSDREIILGFYQQVLEPELLPRVEVDWHRSLVDTDRKFLRHLRDRHESTDYLVVVKVRRADVDVLEIVSQREIDAFRYVAIAADEPVRNENLGRLKELAQLAGEASEGNYERIADELALRRDAPSSLSLLLRGLLNPILVVEAYNALVDVQVEGVPVEAQETAIHQRILARLAAELSPSELVAAAIIANEGLAAYAARVGEAEHAQAVAGLRARMLIRDGKLVRWAALMQRQSSHELVRDQLQRLMKPAAPVTGLAYASGFYSGLTSAPRSPVHMSVLATLRWIREGKLGPARDELEALEPRLEEHGVTEEVRGDYWDAAGRLRQAEGRWPEAEAAFRKALELLEGASDVSRATTMYELACGLRDNGQWDEAEPLFREALLLGVWNA